jgi:hypothetical protein
MCTVAQASEVLKGRAAQLSKYLKNLAPAPDSCLVGYTEQQNFRSLLNL